MTRFCPTLHEWNVNYWYDSSSMLLRKLHVMAITVYLTTHAWLKSLPFLVIMFLILPHFPLAGSFCGTPLHHAAKKGLEQTVHLLLTHGGIPWSIYMKCFIHLSWIVVVLLNSSSCSQSFHTKWWLQYCPWIGKRKGPCECRAGHRGMLCTGCPTVHVVLMEKYSFWLFHIFLI